jgi:hypothetical protein
MYAITHMVHTCSLIRADCIVPRSRLVNPRALKRYTNHNLQGKNRHQAHVKSMKCLATEVAL